MILTASVADPYHIDSDPDPTFHPDTDTDPDPTFQCDTTHFYQDLDPPMFQNDPLRLPPFHRILFDPDPAFHFDADPDPDPASQNDADTQNCSRPLG